MWVVKEDARERGDKRDTPRTPLSMQTDMRVSCSLVQSCHPLSCDLLRADSSTSDQLTNKLVPTKEERGVHLCSCNSARTQSQGDLCVRDQPRRSKETRRPLPSKLMDLLSAKIDVRCLSQADWQVPALILSSSQDNLSKRKLKPRKGCSRHSLARCPSNAREERLLLSASNSLVGCCSVHTYDALH